MRIFLLIVLVLWIINEILQYTEAVRDIIVLNFLVIHLSSFFGSVVFVYLVEFLNLKKIFYGVPLFIEVVLSIYQYGYIDSWDLLFSIGGIITASLIICRSKNYL
jgi:hypothetical protein